MVEMMKTDVGSDDNDDDDDDDDDGNNEDDDDVIKQARSHKKAICFVCDDYTQALRPLSTLNFGGDRKSTRLNSSHANISYAVFCLKKKSTQVKR